MDSSRTLLEWRDWILTPKPINSAAAHSHMRHRVHISTPCVLLGSASIPWLSCPCKANTIIGSMWTDRSVDGSMDRCATFRPALECIRLIAEGKKTKTLLASVMAARGQSVVANPDVRLSSGEWRAQQGQELLFCLGCFNTRNGLRSTSRDDFVVCGGVNSELSCRTRSINTPSLAIRILTSERRGRSAGQQRIGWI